MQSQTGKETIYGKDGIPEKYLVSIQRAAVIAFLLTVAIVSVYLFDQNSVVKRSFVVAAWVGWACLPPAWFSYEYFTLYKTHGREGTFEAFKYGQDIAAKAWLAVAAVLTVIVSK